MLVWTIVPDRRSRLRPLRIDEPDQTEHGESARNIAAVQPPAVGSAVPPLRDGEHPQSLPRGLGGLALPVVGVQRLLAACVQLGAAQRQWFLQVQRLVETSPG